MAAPKREGILRGPSGAPSRHAITFAKGSPSVVQRPVIDGRGSIKPVVWKDELYAASTGEVNWLQMCLQKTESPTQADINGFSALHTSALFGRLDCLKMLVEKYGVSVDLASLTGWRPIHLVMNKESENRALECLQYLIGKEADVNVQNQNGISPLHKAASEGRTDCVKVLIEAGADVHAKDTEGQEPIDLCRMWGHRGCSKYLASAMWKIDKQNLAREVRRLDEIKKECQAKEEESLRRRQMELNHFNNLVFFEWLERKRLPPPSARILSFLEKRAQSVTLRKPHGRQDSVAPPPSSPGGIGFFDAFEKDWRRRAWNTSANPASLPATRLSRPDTVRLGVSPEPSVDHDFSAFLFLVEDGYGEAEIRIGKCGEAFPMPALPWETIQRSLYPHAWPSRLRVPQDLRPHHIWDVKRKRPPGPEHRWTDQMALSLRQTLDPAFLAALKAHLATYSDAEVLPGGLDSDWGDRKERASPSLGSGSGRSH
ncbi:PREDICTED: ankyrin repeat domain-containing protein 53 [Gekko japonicus]|uniref:Ankyrin repeat domain-containing protein 53 n=1 Tax=Gekko japonicus TaxID=146911 RepID=A0ABM1K6L4_GEKJA|nr:PREDICTED: ankyrin repeat domain-containing protein 53 [Gekko japonicus]